MTETKPAAITITYSDSGNKGRYIGAVSGLSDEAELTISKASPTLVIADHTFVPETLRGQGIAQALAMQLFADARANGQRIVPLCPFVKGYALKHKEELADVIQW